MGLIFWFSSLSVLPTPETPLINYVLKKSAHVGVYAVLYLFWFQALRKSGVDKRKAALWSVIISGLYAVSDEYHQSFTPGRQPAVVDIVFDLTGILVAYRLSFRRFN